MTDPRKDVMEVYLSKPRVWVKGYFQKSVELRDSWSYSYSVMHWPYLVMQLGECLQELHPKSFLNNLQAAVQLSSQAFALIGYFPQQLFTTSIMMERFFVSLGSISFWRLVACPLLMSHEFPSFLWKGMLQFRVNYCAVYKRTKEGTQLTHADSIFTYVFFFRTYPIHCTLLFEILSLGWILNPFIYLNTSDFFCIYTLCSRKFISLSKYVSIIQWRLQVNGSILLLYFFSYSFWVNRNT